MMQVPESLAAALIALRGHAAAGAATADLVLAAAAIFRSCEDPREQLPAARSDEDAERERLRALYRHFPPPVASVVPHRPDLDLRGTAVLATLSYARRAGLYATSEIEDMLSAGAVSPAWGQREALRYRLFLALLPALWDPLESTCRHASLSIL